MMSLDQQFLQYPAYLIPITHGLWVNQKIFDPLALLLITSTASFSLFHQSPSSVQKRILKRLVALK